MEKKQYRKMEIIGAILVCICGTLLHFTYEWSGQNTVVGIFSAVNESVWEHTKLVYFPMLIYAIIELIVLKPNWKRFLAAKSAALAFSTILMISFFYTYSGALGVEILILDIIYMYVLIAVGFLLSYRLYYSKYQLEKYFVLFAFLLIVHFAAEVFFTPFPPHIPLFESHGG